MTSKDVRHNEKNEYIFGFIRTLLVIEEYGMFNKFHPMYMGHRERETLPFKDIPRSLFNEYSREIKIKKLDDKSFAILFRGMVYNMYLIYPSLGKKDKTNLWSWAGCPAGNGDVPATAKQLGYFYKIAYTCKDEISFPEYASKTELGNWLKKATVVYPKCKAEKEKQRRNGRECLNEFYHESNNNERYAVKNTNYDFYSFIDDEKCYEAGYDAGMFC